MVAPLAAAAIAVTVLAALALPLAPSASAASATAAPAVACVNYARTTDTQAAGRAALAAVRRARRATRGRYAAIVDVQEWRGAAYAWAELRLERDASGELRIDGLRGRGAGGTIRLVPNPRTGGDAATVSARALPFVRLGVGGAALRSLRGESPRALDPEAVLRRFAEHADALATARGPMIGGRATSEIVWSRSGDRCAGEPATGRGVTRDVIDVDARTGRLSEHRELEGGDVVARVRYRDGC